MKFLVVGDKMIDRYWSGCIKRLNPEKHSAPLLKGHAIIDFPGGAANVAANVTAMGASVEFISQQSGEIVKNRLVDHDDGIIARFDYEDYCTPISVTELLDASKGCCAIIVSDYGKGAIDEVTIEQIRSLRLPTYVDTKVWPYVWTEWCDAIFPNGREFHTHKCDYVQARTCVVKRGSMGATVYHRNLSHNESVGSKATLINNVTGAGDTTMVAYVLVYEALGSTFPPIKREQFALSVAMDFAAVAVAAPFTAAPTFQDVYKGEMSQELLLIEKNLRT